MKLLEIYDHLYPLIMMSLAFCGVWYIEDLQPGMGLLIVLVGGLYVKGSKTKEGGRTEKLN